MVGLIGMIYIICQLDLGSFIGENCSKLKRKKTKLLKNPNLLQIILLKREEGDIYIKYNNGNMSKNILSENTVIDKLLSLFIKAKADNQGDKFLSNIKQKDPNLAKTWDKVDKYMEAALRAAKEDLKASGISTKDIDSRLKRFDQ